MQSLITLENITTQSHQTLLKLEAKEALMLSSMIPENITTPSYQTLLKLVPMLKPHSATVITLCLLSFFQLHKALLLALLIQLTKLNNCLQLCLFLFCLLKVSVPSLLRPLTNSAVDGIAYYPQCRHLPQHLKPPLYPRWCSYQEATQPLPKSSSIYLYLVQG